MPAATASPARPGSPHLLGRRALAALVAGSLALLLIFLLAAPADARYRAFRIGVHGFNTTQSELDAMRAAKVKTLRTLFNWSRVEKVRPQGGNCSTGQYDWSHYNSLVANADRRNIRLLPMIAGSPRYVDADPSIPPHTSSRAMDSYLCFLRQLVRQYGRGSLAHRFGVTPITEWQVWNEPNLKSWAARHRVNAREYGRFLKLSRREILRVDPRATIVLAGMPEAAGFGISIHEFLRKLYRVRGIERQFDVLAMHPYARNHRGVKGALIRLRRTLRRLGEGRRPVWLTETGYASSGGPHHFLVSSEVGQASRLRKTFQMLSANRRRFKLGTVIWFSFRDGATVQDNTGHWQDYTGLWDVQGNPKPACYRYVDFTGGNCTVIQEAVAPVASGAELSAAGANALEPSPPEPTGP